MYTTLTILNINRFEDDKIKSLAVCAGSGSKLLSNLNVDLVVTGEFSHHEVF